MFKVLSESHPGYALNDLEFIKRSDHARKIALSHAATTNNFNSYYMTLREAANEFEDLHVRINPADANTLEKLEILWPGFYVSFPDGVIHGGNYDGAKLTACDGKKLPELFIARVLPYYGIPDIEASLVQWGPRVFWNLGLPWQNKLLTCNMSIPNAIQNTVITLDWNKIGFNEWRVPAADVIYGQYPKAEAVRKSSNTLWLRIPSLLPTNEEAAKYRAMLRLPDFHEAKNIVFDLRQNGGGDMRWADAFIRAALSDDEIIAYDKAKQALDAVTIRYKVSRENANRIRSVSIDPVTGEIDPGMAALAQHLEDSLAAGETLFTEQQVDNPISEIHPIVNNSRKFYVITDGICVSSCLAMMDQLKLFNNMVHLGLATYADTGYLQINTLDLPKHDELSDVHLTFTYTMAHFDRPWRGDNVPYVPEFVYPGKSWDQNGLEEWAMGIIEP